MKIILLNANFHSGGPESIVGNLPPLGFIYIGGALKKGGYNDVELVDLCKTEFNNDKRLIEYIIAKNPEIIFIGGMASTAITPRCIEIAEKIKEHNQKIKIIFGGVHATYMYQNLLTSHSCIDYIIRGEGEKASLELVTAIDKKGDISAVENIAYRSNQGDHNSICFTPMSEEVLNLDEYLPDWELIDNWDIYRIPTNDEITAVVQYSRGCKHKCSFCGQSVFWRKWHSRSAESFVNEINLLHNKYGVSFFFWADENPAQNKVEWINLLEELKKINLKNGKKLHHMLNTRVDHIIRDEEYLPLYKEAGIISIDLGVESALQNRLDNLNKGTNIEQNKKALQLLRKNNIISIAQILVGLPEETPETLQKTAYLIKEFNPDLLHFFYATPFPWTPFGEAMKDKIVEKDFAKWDYRHPVIMPAKMSIEEMIGICKNIKLEFNFNSTRIRDIIKIEDEYHQTFLINCLIQSLKYRSGKSPISSCI
jgi:anaerobic magnesium-protoporphyrin IX monomethyl ester cyclase